LKFIQSITRGARLRDYVPLLAIAASVAVVDQLTKAWVRLNLPYGQVFMPDFWLTRYLRLIHWQNTGMVGGALQNINTFFIVLSFVVIAIILFYFPRVPAHERGQRLALALLLGGGVGNLIDRLFLGHVVDFISIGSLPVGNLADGSVIAGLAILILGSLLSEPKTSDQVDKPTPPEVR